MKALLIKILIIFTVSVKSLNAYNCQKNTSLNFIKGSSLLTALGKCSWVTDGTGLAVNIIVNNVGDDVYSNKEWDDKQTTYSNYMKSLINRIESTVVNSMYFTNMRFLDENTLNTFSKTTIERLKELSGQRIIEVEIIIDLYRYNKYTDLYYGLLDITIAPLGEYNIFSGDYTKWYGLDDDVNRKDLLYDKEFNYKTPFAGYKNEHKILTQNIVQIIETYINNNFKNIFNTIKKKLLTQTSLPLPIDFEKYASDNDIDGIKYLLWNKKIKLYTDNSPEKSYIIDRWMLRPNTNDKKIQEHLIRTFNKRYSLFKAIDYEETDILRKEFVKAYFPIAKQYVDELTKLNNQ